MCILHTGAWGVLWDGTGRGQGRLHLAISHGLEVCGGTGQDGVDYTLPSHPGKFRILLDHALSQNYCTEPFSSLLGLLRFHLTIEDYIGMIETKAVNYKI